jgi:flagellar hook protein FlgE
MSINSALLSGVSGLIANSAALGAISDNIANVNTVGYKENATQFENLVSAKAAAGNYNSGGVQADVTQLISQQGQFTQTSSPTDLAINGNGFFVVSSTSAGLSNSSTPSFTRAGSFTADSAGFLKNTAGLYLQGWPADSNGNITTSPSDLSKLSTINVSAIGSSPDPTTTATINANLNADTSSTTNGSSTYSATTNSMAMYDADNTTGTKPDFSTQITTYDAQGGQHTFQVDFLKTSTANTWDAEISAVPASQVQGAANGQIASGQVVFNSDGSYDETASTLPTSISLGASTATSGAAWATSLGLPAQSISLDLGSAAGAVTQYASISTTNSSTVNGGPAGSLTGVTVGQDGKVTAQFSNGATRVVAQVALATFPDANALTAVSGNSYAATEQSGVFNLKTPTTGGAGELSSSELEASTVDLSTEFTNLIVTQRAYSAASKIITTADQMLQELISVKQ